MKKIPKVIPPLSQVRLVRADKQTPSWREDAGRRFRVGYYSRQDGLDCIWIVNENGKYEQATDRDFLLKYFEIERLSQEKNLYGVGKRRLRKIRIQSPVERLNGRSSIVVYEAAKEIWERDDPQTLRYVITTLRHGERVVNRIAAAYALNFMHGKSAIPALEESVNNKQEHPKVRGQAAESLASNHREKSHRVLLHNLSDPSKEVRFWCTFSLAEMSDDDALIPLRNLAEKDHRIVKGFWSVSKEAKAAIRKIKKEMRNREGREKGCLFCARKSRKTLEGRRT